MTIEADQKGASPHSPEILSEDQALEAFRTPEIVRIYNEYANYARRTRELAALLDGVFESITGKITLKKKVSPAYYAKLMEVINDLDKNSLQLRRSAGAFGRYIENHVRR